MNLDELERLDAAYRRICKADDYEAKDKAWDDLVSALYGNLPDLLALARDGERHRMARTLFSVEDVETALRDSQNFVALEEENLKYDAAMKERT